MLGQCLGGNWWSDYEGEDQDNDSIGDTAYTSGMISDPLPLVIPANPAVYPNAPELTTAINISQTTEGILEEPLQDEQNQSLPETTTDEDEPVQSTEQIEIPQTSQQSSGASAAAGGGGGGGGAARAVKKATQAITEAAKAIASLVIATSSCGDARCDAGEGCGSCPADCSCQQGISQSISPADQASLRVPEKGYGDAQSTQGTVLARPLRHKIKPLGWILIGIMVLGIIYIIIGRYIRASHLAKRVSHDYSHGEFAEAEQRYDKVKQMYKKLYVWQKRRIIKKLPVGRKE